MKINMIYFRALLSSVLLSGFFLLTGCHTHREDDGHDHGASGSEKEEAHKETTTVTSLTREQMQSIGLTLGKIEQKPLTAVLKVNGRLKVPNNNKAVITSMYGGVIQTLQVEIGMSVKKGQAIATIAHPQFIQLQEEYLTVGSRITYAEQEQQRQRDLNEGNVGALKNLQNADAELRALRTRRASLRQQILLMGIDPDKVSNEHMRSQLTIVSPMNGTISSVLAKVGSYVDVAAPLAEIVDNSQLHLDLHVFEKDLPLLKVGQNIHFTLTNHAGKSYVASIFSIGAVFENDSKTIPVHCSVQGDKAGLIDGMNVIALVSLDNVTSPAVPDEAIVDAEGNSYIFIVTEKEPEEHAHEQMVTADQKHRDAGTLNFEKVQVARGVSELGYTGITLMTDIPSDAQIVTKGAFFIHARMSNTGGHAH